MKRVFQKMALMLVLITALAFLISGTASAHSVVAHQTATTSAHTQSPAISCPPTLKVGSSGSWVKDVQSDLNFYYTNGVFMNAPYNFKPLLKVDGKFGALTQNAVKDWQVENYLVVDGIVGPKTWQSLFYC